jgi:hypothetical protein
MVHDDPKMRYMVFDAWNAKNPQPSSILRYRQMENAGNDIVMPVEQVIVAGNAQAEIDAFFENIVRNGGEGAANLERSDRLQAVHFGENVSTSNGRRDSGCRHQMVSDNLSSCFNLCRRRWRHVVGH